MFSCRLQPRAVAARPISLFRELSCYCTLSFLVGSPPRPWPCKRPLHLTSPKSPIWPLWGTQLTQPKVQPCSLTYFGTFEPRPLCGSSLPSIKPREDGRFQDLRGRSGNSEIFKQNTQACGEMSSGPQAREVSTHGIRKGASEEATPSTRGPQLNQVV